MRSALRNFARPLSPLAGGIAGVTRPRPPYSACIASSSASSSCSMGRGRGVLFLSGLPRSLSLVPLAFPTRDRSTRSTDSWKVQDPVLQVHVASPREGTISPARLNVYTASAEKASSRERDRLAAGPRNGGVDRIGSERASTGSAGSRRRDRQSQWAQLRRVVRQKWRLSKATVDERARRLGAGTEAGAFGGSTRRGRVAPPKVRASTPGSPARHRPGSGCSRAAPRVVGAPPAHRSRAGARTPAPGSALAPARVRGRPPGGARSLPRGCADARAGERARSRAGAASRTTLPLSAPSGERPR